MSHPSRRAFLGTLGAAAVALPEFGSHTIRVGADLSAAAPAAGQQNNKRMAKRKIVPVATVHGGTLMKIDPKVHEAVPHAGLKM
jgi:hypothetical protein